MRKSKKKILLLKKIISSCLFLIATACCYGQTVTLKGVVKDEGGQTLSSVSIVAKQGTIIKAYDISNKKGEFELTLMKNKTYTIGLSSVGYLKLENEYTAILDNDKKKFILKQKNYAEDTVTIVAKRGVFEKGDTIFYNADFYKKNNENNLKDLLNYMPGFKLAPNGKVFIDGEMVNKVLIDGKDLTGDDYEKIVNNLSPHNLDQIQVLKKYKDPYELSNSATGNTEVALNLTLKNKRIIPSVKVASSIGIPIKYYEQRTDFLVITKYFTSINFINLNTIGNTAQLIASPNSLYGTVSPKLFKKLGKGLQYQNNINEVFLNLPKNNYTFNNSQYYDNSSQFNLGKKITNKFSFNYSPEKIEQIESGISKVFIGEQIISETYSFDKPQISKQKGSIKNELIFMLKKNEQIKWNFNYSRENENSINTSSLNSNTVSFINQNNRIYVNSLVNYAKFLKKGKVINLAGYYDIQKNNEQLLNNGIIYNNTIFINSLGNSKSLDQLIKNYEKNLGFYIKLIKRKNDYSFTFLPTYKNMSGSFVSELSSLSTTNIIYNNIDSFRNNFKYNQNSFSIPISYRFDNKDWDVNLSIEPVLLYSKIRNIQNNITNFNAEIRTSYKFKNKRGISINVIRNNDFTLLNKIFATNLIVNNKNKISPTDLFLKEQSYTFNISSYKRGSFNSKPSFNYSISGNINSPNYLLNNNSNNFYTTQNFIDYLATNKGISGRIGNNFTSNELKIRFENDINVSSRKSIASQNSVIIASISNSSQFENKFISKFKGMLNFQINHSLNYNINKRIGFSSTTKSISDIISLAINLNYKKKSHLDIEAKNFYFNTIDRNSQNILLINLSYKQLLYKGKIRLNFDLRNVTNKKAFVSQAISITQFNEYRVTLLPFIALLRLELML